MTCPSNTKIVVHTYVMPDGGEASQVELIYPGGTTVWCIFAFFLTDVDKFKPAAPSDVSLAAVLASGFARWIQSERVGTPLIVYCVHACALLSGRSTID